MTACCAIGCRNRSDRDRTRGVTFHKFPSKDELRQQWIKAVRRENFTPSKSSAVCSAHFQEKAIDRTSQSCVRLREGAVPTIFDFFPKYLRTLKKGRKAPAGRHKKVLASAPPQTPDTEAPSCSTDSLVKQSLKRKLLTAKGRLPDDALKWLFPSSSPVLSSWSQFDALVSHYGETASPHAMPHKEHQAGDILKANSSSADKKMPRRKHSAARKRGAANASARQKQQKDDALQAETVTVVKTRGRGRAASVVDLVMECWDEPLSPAQVAMVNLKKSNHARSQKLIAAARESRLMFTSDGIPTVLNKPLPPPPPLQPATPTQLVCLSSPYMLPPSPCMTPPTLTFTPAISNSGRSSPDVVFVSETPAPRQQTPPQATGTTRKSTIGSPHITSPVPVVGTSGLGVRLPKGWTIPSLPGKKELVATPVSPQTPRSQQGSGWHAQVPAAAPGKPTPRAVTPATYHAASEALTHLRQQMQEEAQAKVDSEPQRKKSRKQPQLEGDASGKWVPLDEYYYGKMEGNPTYQEEKGEFRFKCWYCFKMLYNNVATMMHIQGHIDSDRQVNLDLSDLTQCKHCYKQFDTPFEMQTHIEKVHMNNTNVLLCRICEKDHESRTGLTDHMRRNHTACEMPYTCHLCRFKSSMYSDVVDHFKKKHYNSPYVLCLYCLRVFQTRFVAQGWGQTSIYYNHLMKHQAKAATKKCQLCKLIFLNAADLKQHRMNDHLTNQKGVKSMNAKYTTPDQVMIKVTETTPEGKHSGGVKSLNVPAVRKVVEHRLTFPESIYKVKCVECSMLMGMPDHFKKFIQCSMCRFATSCSFAYANHMMGFHSGQMTAAVTQTPSEGKLSQKLFCSCGFASCYGNRIANHLVSCSKSSCYKDPPPPPVSAPSEEFSQELQDPRRKPGASLLDVLGLVKKNALSASRSAVRHVSPPPPPVDMPDVKLSASTTTRRPSLLRDSMKRSFKNILKEQKELDSPEEIQPAKFLASQPTPADGAKNVNAPEKDVLKGHQSHDASQDLVEGGATSQGVTSAEDDERKDGINEMKDEKGEQEDAKSVAVDEDVKSVAVDEDVKSVAVDEDAKSIAVDEDAKFVAVDEDAKSVAVDEDAKCVADDDNEQGNTAEGGEQTRCERHEEDSKKQVAESCPESTTTIAENINSGSESEDVKAELSDLGVGVKGRELPMEQEKTADVEVTSDTEKVTSDTEKVTSDTEKVTSDTEKVTSDTEKAVCGVKSSDDEKARSEESEVVVEDLVEKELLEERVAGGEGAKETTQADGVSESMEDNARVESSLEPAMDVDLPGTPVGEDDSDLSATTACQSEMSGELPKSEELSSVTESNEMLEGSEDSGEGSGKDGDIGREWDLAKRVEGGGEDSAILERPSAGDVIGAHRTAKLEYVHVAKAHPAADRTESVSDYGNILNEDDDGKCESSVSEVEEEQSAKERREDVISHASPTDLSVPADTVCPAATDYIPKDKDTENAESARMEDSGVYAPSPVVQLSEKMDENRDRGMDEKIDQEENREEEMDEKIDEGENREEEMDEKIDEGENGEEEMDEKIDEGENREEEMDEKIDEGENREEEMDTKCGQWSKSGVGGVGAAMVEKDEEEGGDHETTSVQASQVAARPHIPTGPEATESSDAALSSFIPLKGQAQPDSGSGHDAEADVFTSAGKETAAMDVTERSRTLATTKGSPTKHSAHSQLTPREEASEEAIEDGAHGQDAESGMLQDPSEQEPDVSGRTLNSNQTPGLAVQTPGSNQTLHLLGQNLVPCSTPGVSGPGRTSSVSRTGLDSSNLRDQAAAAAASASSSLPSSHQQATAQSSSRGHRSRSRDRRSRSRDRRSRSRDRRSRSRDRDRERHRDRDRDYDRHRDRDRDRRRDRDNRDRYYDNRDRDRNRYRERDRSRDRDRYRDQDRDYRRHRDERRGYR